MADNEKIVRDFIAAWSRLNVDELVGYFAADGVYHNMMSPPVGGHENLRKFIGSFVKSWKATEWKILNVLSRGEVVVAERLDCTDLAGKRVELPCCGVFVMQGGKIKEWRDYFDLATYMKALALGK